MHLRHLILLHLFLPPRATKCLLKNATSWWVPSRFLWMASERRPLNAALHKKLSLRSFHRKFYTIKDGTQTYDYIADKSCLLFFIILKVLSRWQVIRTQGKCIKSYKNFLKDFVVEQNLTGVKGDFWSYLKNCPYEIVVIWDDRTTGNLDPCLLT